MTSWQGRRLPSQNIPKRRNALCSPSTHSRTRLNMAAAVDLDTREGPITVRLGEGAADAPSARPLSPARARSSISSTRSASGMPGAPPAPVATPPKHDSEELDPVAADLEKKAADMRDLLGEEPEGNVVPGIEDDVLWTLIRRFDTVSRDEHPATANRSKSTMS